MGCNDESPVVKLTAEQLRYKTATFLIDTGADINVIKLNALREDITVDVRDSIEMRGITDERIETLGTTIVAILGQPILFYAVRSNFSIYSDGILGKAYLRQEKAEISFAHNTIVTQS